MACLRYIAQHVENSSRDGMFVLAIRRSHARKTEDVRAIILSMCVLTQLASAQSQAMDSSDGHTFSSTSSIVIRTDRSWQKAPSLVCNTERAYLRLSAWVENDRPIIIRLWMKWTDSKERVRDLIVEGKTPKSRNLKGCVEVLRGSLRNQRRSLGGRGGGLKDSMRESGVWKGKYWICQTERNESISGILLSIAIRSQV